MKQAFDIYCDSPRCSAHVRLVQNGEAGGAVLAQWRSKVGTRWIDYREVAKGSTIDTALPPGWGRIGFESMTENVSLDFCPQHLEQVVEPWVAHLAELEDEVRDLGPTPNQVDLDAVRVAAPPPIIEPEVEEVEEDDFGVWHPEVMPTLEAAAV